MTLEEMVQAGSKHDGVIWYSITSFVSRTFKPRYGAQFAAGFEAALHLISSFGVPSDLDELFQQREDERGL